jgi:hypothetical protein
VHQCPVPGAKCGWIDLTFVDDQGLPVTDGAVTFDGATLDLAPAKEPGRVRRLEPVAQNNGKTSVTVGEQKLEVQLPVLPVPTIVRLPKKEST